MTKELSQEDTQKENDINLAWEQHKREQASSAPSKDEVFEMREKGQI